MWDAGINEHSRNINQRRSLYSVWIINISFSCKCRIIDLQWERGWLCYRMQQSSISRVNECKVIIVEFRSSTNVMGAGGDDAISSKVCRCGVHECSSVRDSMSVVKQQCHWTIGTRSGSSKAREVHNWCVTRRGECYFIIIVTWCRKRKLNELFTNTELAV